MGAADNWRFNGKMIDKKQYARDQTLANKLIAGDQRAFAEFNDEYLPKLFRYAIVRLKDEQVVEEILQITLISAAKYLHSYRGEAALLTWLIQILRHETSRFLAKEKRYQNLNQRWQDNETLQLVVDSHAAPSTDNPDQMHAREQLSILIRDVLDQLPPNYARALELKYIREMGSKDIATELQISDEAAQSLLARARRAFRGLCDESLLALMKHVTKDAPSGGLYG